MRYHYEKPELYMPVFGKTTTCNHPVYSSCTLYTIGNKGLAVIQQRFDPITKSTYWTSIDPWLVNGIYLNTWFRQFFEKVADVPKDGLYPTVTIRHVMWELRMKPLKKEPWETVFDRTRI